MNPLFLKPCPRLSRIAFRKWMDEQHTREHSHRGPYSCFDGQLRSHDRLESKPFYRDVGIVFPSLLPVNIFYFRKVLQNLY